MRSLNLLNLVLFVMVLMGCTHEAPPAGPPSDQELDNAIFPGSLLIEAGIPDFGAKVEAMPTFTWHATGQRYVYVGVFNENLIVKDGSIRNSHSNVWAWHSGLGTGREGNITFSDGVDVIDGVPKPGSSPTPLISGMGYVWGVWAWNNDGTTVLYSSKEMFFTVK